MGTSAQPAAEREPRRSSTVVLQSGLAQARRLLVIVLALAGLGLGLAALAGALQAGRDEARRADILLVVAPAVPGAPLIDHAFELYRRGYARQVVVAGAGRPQMEAALRERGLPPDALGTPDDAAAVAERLRSVRAAGGDSALVVAQPDALLLHLKLAHDQGLRAYGSPPRGQPVEPLALLHSAVSYWAYVLLGRLDNGAG